MTRIKVNNRGDWLRSDAAFSYFRMINAGCPLGGIDVFGRTIGEQWNRWREYVAGRGPVAAFPTLKAPHVRGVAMDARTTTAGRYTPSKAHQWLTKGGQGSRPSPFRDGKPVERIQANEFGWRRTVRSERWHYAYDAALDEWDGPRTKYRNLQAALQASGYPIQVDGVFGRETFQVLGRFQKDHDMPVTFVDGPETWNVLNQFI